jgi:hypothetical protein
MTELWQAYKKLSWWKKALLALPMVVALLALGWLYLRRDAGLDVYTLAQHEAAMNDVYDENDDRMEALDDERETVVEKQGEVNGKIRQIYDDHAGDSYSIDDAGSVRELMGVYHRLTNAARTGRPSMDEKAPSVDSPEADDS